MGGFSQPSPLENILDKDDYTLEEVAARARLASLLACTLSTLCCGAETCVDTALKQQ